MAFIWVCTAFIKVFPALSLSVHRISEKGTGLLLIPYLGFEKVFLDAKKVFFV
ncbi:hypothetical protein P5640_00035 (plasmid) [Bacillus subtilis]|nr:hypothetical protein P5640_00100 [Bacillus subtilis]WGE04211.1 hypothetical protein P5640_00035 [Bacillus subtilis]